MEQEFFPPFYWFLLSVVWQSKKFNFAAKAFSQGPIMCLIEIYLIKLSVGLGHDVLNILLPAAVFLGQLIHSGNSSELMKNYFRSLVHYRK